MLLLPLFSHGDVFSGRTSQRQNLNDGNVILRTIPFSMARAAQTAPVRELCDTLSRNTYGGFVKWLDTPLSLDGLQWQILLESY